MTCANPNGPVVVDLVKLYQISWAEYLTISGEERRIGFGLELSAAHEPGTGHLGPGCPACRHTYEALHEVADRILPTPERSSLCRVCPYGQPLRYSKARGSRPDVVLRLKVLHEGGPERVTGQCELRCMKLMEATLAGLGACQQRWSLPETQAWIAVPIPFFVENNKIKVEAQAIAGGLKNLAKPQDNMLQSGDTSKDPNRHPETVHLAGLLRVVF